MIWIEAAEEWDNVECFTGNGLYLGSCTACVCVCVCVFCFVLCASCFALQRRTNEGITSTCHIVHGASRLRRSLFIAANVMYMLLYLSDLIEIRSSFVISPFASTASITYVSI